MLEGGRFSWMVEIHDEFDLQQSGMNSATVRFEWVYIDWLGCNQDHTGFECIPGSNSLDHAGSNAKPGLAGLECDCCSSYEQGERIASQVQRMTPMPFGEDRFILNKDDKKVSEEDMNMFS